MTHTTTSAINTQTRTVDGLSIRYAESAPGRDRDALLLSPWPESLYCFEPMWEQLAEHAHLVAVDLPGFGHSEGRDDLFNSRAMGDFVLKLADAFELEQPHAVGPDIGTSALLFAGWTARRGCAAWWWAAAVGRCRSSSVSSSSRSSMPPTSLH